MLQVAPLAKSKGIATFFTVRSVGSLHLHKFTRRRAEPVSRDGRIAVPDAGGGPQDTAGRDVRQEPMGEPPA